MACAAHLGTSRKTFATRVLTLACGISLLYKALMKTTKPTIATAELLLIFPGLLFMTALFVRNLQPLQYEPAHSAQQIVDWYALRPHLCLWGFLIAMPLAVLVTGLGTLVGRWSAEPELRSAARELLATLRTHLATFSVAAATVAAGAVLSIVALHLITD